MQRNKDFMLFGCIVMYYIYLNMFLFKKQKIRSEENPVAYGYCCTEMNNSTVIFYILFSKEAHYFSLKMGCRGQAEMDSFFFVTYVSCIHTQ